MALVADASVWVSVFLRQDAHHRSSRQWLESYLQTSHTELIAPTLLLAEVASALTRRTGRPKRGYDAIRHLLGQRTVRFMATDIWLGLRAAEIAADYALRGADAVYVALAEALHAPLITWDQEQLARAQRVVSAWTPDSHPLAPYNAAPACAILVLRGRER